jgi:hypothetical protein
VEVSDQASVRSRLPPGHASSRVDGPHKNAPPSTAARLKTDAPTALCQWSVGTRFVERSGLVSDLISSSPIVVT